MFGPPDWLDRVAQWLVIAAAVIALFNGAAMLIDPLGWYFILPTVIATGPPNSHFIRDIGAAYLMTAAILGFAAANLRMRWLAAAAGSSWLILHALVHVFEVSVGICSPADFVQDIPGVMGPPILVIVALGIMLTRQRIAPMGVPKAVFLKAATAKVDESDAQYLHEVAAAPGHALEKFKHFMPASLHRHTAPPNLFHAARMGATLAEDCGPCAMTCARWAEVDGVAKEVINRWLAGGVDVPADERLAIHFGRAIATQGDDAFALGDQIEAEYGRDVRFELVMTAALVRAYPAMKRGLGLTKACSLTPLEI